MAVALTALDASVILRGPQGDRSLPIEHFYRLPGDAPHIENELKPGELIIAVELPAAHRQPRSSLPQGSRPQSYAFALVSVAAVLDIGPGQSYTPARIALGGVAPKPWRVPDAESIRSRTICR